MMDGMTIYSPSSGGLFSVFDADIIGTRSLYWRFSEYGGRVSSIMDIKTKMEIKYKVNYLQILLEVSCC